MCLKKSSKENFLKITGIIERDLNLLFGGYDQFIEQVEYYINSEQTPINVDSLYVHPKDSKVDEFDFYFLLHFNCGSKRKRILYDKIKVDDHCNTSEDLFNVYAELFCDEYNFLSMRAIWGIAKGIFIQDERDVDSLFENSPRLQHIMKLGRSYMYVADRISAYLWKVHKIEIVPQFDIFLHLDSKQTPTFFLGWNNVRRVDNDPIVIQPEYEPHIENEFLND